MEHQNWTLNPKFFRSNFILDESMKETIIISLGGSVIVPDKIDTNFLKKFRKLILTNLKKDKRFVIICGGGKTAREYISAISSVGKMKNEDLDWIGIHATRLNSQVLRAVFKDVAYRRIIKNPRERVRFEKVLIAAGWKPGFSTDYDAVLLAKTYGVKRLINLTNIDYVYNKNPTEYKDAKPIKEISWGYFRGIVGEKWKPGLSAPFDPIAAKKAEKYKLQVIIANGNNMQNIDNLLEGRGFIGTTIK